jgi:hypothetical protein
MILHEFCDGALDNYEVRVLYSEDNSIVFEGTLLEARRVLGDEEIFFWQYVKEENLFILCI